ncbi:MAG: hypothetical protein AAF204_03885, partial [Pseudomonadota bacterium]
MSSGSSVMFKHSLSLVSAIILVAACTPGKSLEDEVGGQFWQRTSVSEAIYQQGPKAQQILNRDISRCVTELRELERLGTLKNAIPTDFHGRTLDPDDKELADWDSPERNKHLYAEHGDFTDFESCMGEKGWERVEHTPFDVARKGRINYLRAHVDKDYIPENTKKAKRQPTTNDVG